MITKKLDVKPVEYRLAMEEIGCNTCGRNILVGNPFMRRHQIRSVDGEYVMTVTIECLYACGDHHRNALTDARPDQEACRQRKVPPFDRCWEGRASGDETTKVFTKNGLICVATGYCRIVYRGVYRFLEADEKQIQKRQFARDGKGDDSAGLYEGWLTSCGMCVRRYLKDDRDSVAGRWYMPLEFIVTEGGLKF